MGEYQIITLLAADEVAKGISYLQSVKNAQIQYKIALEEALNYEYKPKGEISESKCRYKQTIYIANRIRVSRFKHGNEDERKLVNELSSIMYSFGYVEGEELYSYISDCINIEKNIAYWIGTYSVQNDYKVRDINIDKVYKFFSSEINRLKVLNEC